MIHGLSLIFMDHGSSAIKIVTREWITYGTDYTSTSAIITNSNAIRSIINYLSSLWVSTSSKYIINHGPMRIPKINKEQCKTPQAKAILYM